MIPDVLARRVLLANLVQRNSLIFVFVFGSSFAFFPVHAQDPSLVSIRTASTPLETPVLEPPVAAAGDPLYAPVATSGVPQTLHERLMDYAIVSVGPRTLFAPAVYAGYRMANPPNAYPRDWRDGAGAFGRNYGNAFAAEASLETGQIRDRRRLA